MKRLGFVLLILIGCHILFKGPAPRAQEAGKIVETAWNYYQGQSSFTLVDMVIHRANWSRQLTIKVWTQGRKDCIFKIMSPPKDEGIGTLKIGREMWTYTPRINRTIKIPPSLMSQPWMGSDFSNHELSKADSVVEDYVHEITGREKQGDHMVYIIKAIPKDNAPVVWGEQMLRIRHDHVLLKQSFYDEDGKLVKEMTGSRIKKFGDRFVASVWHMRKAENPDEFTKLVYRKVEYDISIPSHYFSLSSLKDHRL